MINKLMLMTALVIGGVSAAHAQPAPASDLPSCSKTVTDKCINRTVTKKVVKHKKTTRTTRTTTRG